MDLERAVPSSAMREGEGGAHYQTVWWRTRARHGAAKNSAHRAAARASVGMPEVQGEETMSKILSTAIIAGLLFAVAAPAFAADAPKTKADCEKTKDMKWDDAKKVCVKK